VKLYSGYHADRPPVPNELQWQFDNSRWFYESFGWYVTYDESVEADDLLGTYAQLETEAGGRTLILPGDRDMFQCAGDSVTVLYVKTGSGVEEVDRRGVVKRYGVLPEQVPDFIALRGDPSDGIPGAKGIGEKTAAELLQRHGSLDAALEGALRESKPTIRKALVDQRDELLRFREIATLQDVDVQLPPDTPTDFAGAAAAAREREMNRLAERMEKEAA
jgi:5'-3' exonuclease